MGSPRPGPAVRCRALGLLGAVCLALSAPAVSQAGPGTGAFWRSLLIPGWGQFEQGRRTSGARFLATEAALWGGFAGMRYLAAVRADVYRTWAAEHAGAETAGKGTDFFDDLGFYQSRAEHDRYARYREGPSARLYADGPATFWAWDGEAPRLRYRQLRNASLGARRQALYATGLVLANHLLAAIHASRGAAGGADDGSRPAVGLQAAGRRGWALVVSRSL